MFPPPVRQKKSFHSFAMLVLAPVMAIGFLAQGGCHQTATESEAKMPSVPPTGAEGTFATKQFAMLHTGDDKPTDIYFRDKYLFVYTQKHLVYVLDSNSLQIKWITQVRDRATHIRPPVVLPNFIVIPTISSLEIYDPYGRNHQSYPTKGLALHSGAVGYQTRIYFGGDAPGGGRVVCVDLNGSPYQKYSVAWELATRGGISAAPAALEGLVYVADDQGNVYAVNAFNREPMWPMKEQGREEHVFGTAGAIRADVKADHYGVYIASMDTKLYCLNPKTGRIQWQFFAGQPLIATPEVTQTSVYEYLEGTGIIALDKTKGDVVRKPRWTFRSGVRFLSEDSKYAYLQQADHSVIAVDLESGTPRYVSHRKDYAAFAIVNKGDMIYSVSDAGIVRAAEPRSSAMNFNEVAMIQALQMEPIASH